MRHPLGLCKHQKQYNSRPRYVGHSIHTKTLQKENCTSYSSYDWPS